MSAVCVLLTLTKAFLQLLVSLLLFAGFSISQCHTQASSCLFNSLTGRENSPIKTPRQTYTTVVAVNDDEAIAGHTGTTSAKVPGCLGMPWAPYSLAAGPKAFPVNQGNFGCCTNKAAGNSTVCFGALKFQAACLEV